MKPDSTMIYGIETRLIDLEEKVADLERQVRREKLQDSISSSSPVPENLRNRIEAGEHPVRVFRLYRMLTQKELGQLAGLRENHVSAIERGREYGLKTARSLAKALDVPPELFQKMSTRKQSE